MALGSTDITGLFETSDTTVDPDSQVLNAIGDSLKTSNKRRALLTIGTSGGSVIAFDQFTIEGRIEEGSGDWLTIQAAWGTGEEDNILLLSPTDLATLAHGDTEWALLDIGGFAEIRCQSAQVGATAAAVTRTLKIRLVD